MRRPLLIAYTFVLMNWAAVLGLYHFVRGHKDIWHRNRSAGQSLIKGAADSGAH